MDLADEMGFLAATLLRELLQALLKSCHEETVDSISRFHLIQQSDYTSTSSISFAVPLATHENYVDQQAEAAHCFCMIVMQWAYLVC